MLYGVKSLQVVVENDELRRRLLEGNSPFQTRLQPGMETPLDVLSRAASLVHADDEKRQIMVALLMHVQQLLKLKQQAMQQQKAIQPQAGKWTSPEGSRTARGDHPPVHEFRALGL
ncbi:hypothetical protein MDA_GLEAN10023743 [Myotis davidii]|uniref:Uncharacterized protein n=1 Tax=Myotis davidii TaxID=225400 RepID=L5M7L4_MYODS|nr:hypothetical protein MDA_GLEAN10023743 [Myotis davidii]